MSIRQPELSGTLGNSRKHIGGGQINDPKAASSHLQLSKINSLFEESRIKNCHRHTGKRNTVSSSNNQTTRLRISSLTLRSEKNNNNGTERLRALKYFLDLLSSILVNPQQCLASFIPKKNKRYMIFPRATAHVARRVFAGST